jgi:drug/metabolite transporter (DMT)-like permease
MNTGSIRPTLDAALNARSTALAAGCSRRWLPIAAVLAAAACWGTQGIAYALILHGVPTDGLTVVTLRAVTATALLWVWLGLTNRAALRVARADIPGFALLGFVAVTLFYPALFYAYAWTSVAVATTLLYLAPAFVTLGATALLREPLTRRKLAALALAVFGSGLVVEIDQPARLAGSVPGVALGLVAAVSYAAYSLLGKGLLARHRPPTILAYYLLFGTLGLLILKMAVSPAAWPAPDAALPIGLYTGVMTTLAPIALYTFALRRLPASEASILLTFEPVVAFAAAGAVLGQTLGADQWLGAIAVLAGVVLLALPAVEIRRGAIGRQPAG